MSLTVIDHPLVADRVLQMRDERTSATDFRRLTREVATFLAYEATRELTTAPATVTTPLGLPAEGRRVVEPGPLVVPVLRAGLGLLDGVLTALPAAEVGVIGLRRDEETFRPVAYCEKLPDDLTGRTVYVIDPMLATGGSLAAACAMVASRGASRLVALCMIAAPEGVRHVEAAGHDVAIYTAALDAGLNDQAFITPGLGDAGDRLFGAGSSR